MKRQDTTAPPERSLTPRRQLMEALEQGPATVRELSRLAGMSERQVLDNLEHVKKSGPIQGRKLAVTPAACLECGFEFTKRERFSRPGRCPVCKSQRISLPRFSLE